MPVIFLPDHLDQDDDAAGLILKDKRQKVDMGLIREEDRLIRPWVCFGVPNRQEHIGQRSFDISGHLRHVDLHLQRAIVTKGQRAQRLGIGQKSNYGDPADLRHLRGRDTSCVYNWRMPDASLT